MRDWDDEVYKMLAKKTISLDDDWDHKETDALIEDHVIRDGTYAFLDTISAMNVEEKEVLADKYKTHWFKSNETLMSESVLSRIFELFEYSNSFSRILLFVFVFVPL